jgi:N-methyl-L-proline demethylase
LCVEIGSDHTKHRTTRHVDYVITDHGTAVNADLYFELKPRSVNLGAIDYGALTQGRPQELLRNADGAFRLFRIGDAVASRNIHAAIYDALRLIKDV